MLQICASDNPDAFRDIKNHCPYHSFPGIKEIKQVKTKSKGKRPQFTLSFESLTILTNQELLHIVMSANIMI